MVTFFPELAEGLARVTEVFFEEVQGSFPESLKLLFLFH
jgi:hypothetical protein